MLADSLADVVAEEVATRLLLVLNLECQAKVSEKLGRHREETGTRTR